jgi:hypothetical protein
VPAGEFRQQAPATTGGGLTELEQHHAIAAHLLDACQPRPDEFQGEPLEKGPGGASSRFLAALLQVHSRPIAGHREPQTKNRRAVPWTVLGLEDQEQISRRQRFDFPQACALQEWRELFHEFANLTGVEAQESSSSML